MASTGLATGAASVTSMNYVGFEDLKGQLERLGQSAVTVDAATRLIHELSGIHREEVDRTI